jgi:hypothetical protein
MRMVIEQKNGVAEVMDVLRITDIGPDNATCADKEMSEGFCGGADKEMSEGNCGGAYRPGTTCLSCKSRNKDGFIYGYKACDIERLASLSPEEELNINTRNGFSIRVRCTKDLSCVACVFRRHTTECASLLKCTPGKRADGQSVQFLRVHRKLFPGYILETLDKLHEEYNHGNLEDDREERLYTTLQVLGDDLLPVEVASLKETAMIDAGHVFVFEKKRYVVEALPKGENGVGHCAFYKARCTVGGADFCAGERRADGVSVCFRRF